MRDESEEIILIPAYKPDKRFVAFMQLLRAKGYAVVVIDDGSGEEYLPVFAEAEKIDIPVLRHDSNRGKGRALKTGLEAIWNEYPSARRVVTADCDGQHSLEDIQRVFQSMREHPGTLIIGGRFSKKDDDVPARSAFGNVMTRWIFRLATGLKIRDTQTGLRGIPREWIPRMVTLRGERYEYEMNMLLSIKDWSVPYLEIPISTIYIDDNKGSHYHPVRDSLRILRQILQYSAVAFGSFLVDYAAYLFFCNLLGWGVGLSFILARIISSVPNVILNSKLVFKETTKWSIVKYYILWFVVLALGSAGSKCFSDYLHFPNLLCKIFVDIPLFVLSFYVQREFVFKKKRSS